MSDESENYLCVDCVGDSQLKSEIDTNGSLNSCFHCEQQKMCIDIEELADRVDEVYRKHYRPSETPVFDKDDGDSIKWKHAGDHPEYIIAEMIEADIEIGQKIADILSDRYRYQVLHDGDDDYYDTTDTYESTPIDTYEYSQTWKDFCEQIKHKSRFFGPRNLDALDLIFDKITEYKTDQGIKPIREIGPDDFAFRHIYRAREASDEQTILKINEDPSKELGVPPVKKAKASRMNYAGIPVLYASFDPDTCVAEIRLPVGAIAVVGKFEFIRPIRVLDLTVFDESAEAVSMFHPNFDEIIVKRAFLSDFHSEIRKPVLPRDEDIDYVPTQTVAEYLANKFEPSLDGLIFSSVQTDGKGRNIVIFNHAALIQDSFKDVGDSKDAPKKKGYFWGDSFVISDLEYLVQPQENEDPLIFLDGRMDDAPALQKRTENNKPSLRLVKDSLEVRKVTAVKYETERFGLIEYTTEDANRYINQMKNPPKL